MTTRRLRALSLASLALLVALGAVQIIGRVSDSESTAAAQNAPTELRDAYRLVDTWDGSEGQGAPGSVLLPAGIDMTNDRVLLVDRGNNRVQQFTPGGGFVAAWGREGDALDQFDDPRDIAIGENRFFVSDTGNDRIVVYSLTGQPLEAWTTTSMSEPWGVAWGGERLFVSLPSRGEIVALADGAEVARWSGLEEPRGIDVGADGRVYVADRGASEIRFFTADGVPAGKLRMNLPPIDIAVDRIGDMYVQTDGAILWYPAGSNSSRQALYYPGMQGLTLTPQRGIYATAVRPQSPGAVPFHGVLHYPWQPTNVAPTEWPLLGFPPGRMNAPRTVHVGPSGRIWVLDAWPRIQAFEPSGRPGTQIVVRTGVPPVSIAESPSGELIVGETRRLLRMQPSGQITQFVRLGDGPTNYWLTAHVWREGLPRVSMVDSALLAVRDYGVTRTLQPIGSWPLATADGWTLYWDIAVPSPNPKERTYIVNRGQHEIAVYEAARLVDSWAIEGVPIRAAVGPHGHLFVLTLDGLVRKFTAGGQLVAAWDVGAYSAGESRVVDIDVDASGRVYTVDELADTVRVWELDPGVTPEPPASRGGLCRLRGDKRAEPEALRIGERVTVRLQVGGECPNTSPRADIVLAIDRSGSMMDNGKITATKEAALVFIGQIDLARDRVGVVSFNNNARVAQPLTHDRQAAENAVRAITAVGGTNVADAFRVSTDELFGPNSRPDTQPVIVLLTDGRDRLADRVLDEAARAQEMGTRVFTIGFGDVDPMVMVLSATSPEDYYYAPDPSTLAEIYTQIARRITAEYLATSMTIVDELPANMRYIEGSARPAAAWDPAARTLTWQLTNVPFTGAQVTFQVEPLELGRHPTNVEAGSHYVDGLDEQGDLRFPVPVVDVLSLEPTATPTSTPFPTPTPLPTSTPIPPEPLFLPIAVHQVCKPEAFHADVALVMDTSSSMKWPSSEGSTRSKLDVAVEAAHTFVDLLTLPGDQATIVSFNREAEVVQALTGDQAALHAGLDRLEPKVGTRIDRGIEAATTELTSERAIAENNQVMILLTDGRSSSVEDSVVREKADEAKVAGITIYTIGLGDDVDEELLREIATYPEYAFLAPTAEELEQIYRDIAYTLECPNLVWP
jgi:Mg-chelatase subunit ChlD